MSSEDRITFRVLLPPEADALGDVLKAVVETGAGRIVQQPLWKVRGRLSETARLLAKRRRLRLWPVLILPEPHDDLELACWELMTPAKAERLAVALAALGSVERAPIVAPRSVYEEWRAEHGA